MSEKTIEEKYKHAIIALQTIAQRDGSYENGVYNEWTEAEAFRDCKMAAIKALKYLGEDIVMSNRKNKIQLDHIDDGGICAYRESSESDRR